MKLYSYNIKQMTEHTYLEWINLVSEEKKRRIERFIRESDKKLCLAGDALARRAIHEMCGIRLEEIKLLRDKFGKPYADNLGIHFNISHSGEWVICGIDDKPIGVDIERVTRANMDTARIFCTDNELSYIFDNCKRDMHERFFRIWTLKEAYFKNIGTGLVDMKGISFFIDNNGGVSCNKEGYTFESLNSIDSYIVSICRRIN